MHARYWECYNSFEFNVLRNECEVSRNDLKLRDFALQKLIFLSER